MIIRGELVALVPYTRERCHEFYRSYVSDPAMWDFTYVYDKQRVNDYYDNKVQESSRRFFAVNFGEKTVGEVQLKYIDFEKGCGTLSIHLQNDSAKGRGFGTEAEELMLRYAFHTLHLNVVYADATHRNMRSRHVLESVGFQHLYDDDTLCYYQFQK